jgi:hypothetical protein
VIPLRPLGLGEILDGAISTMRAHPRAILGVSAVVATVTQVIIAVATFPLLKDVARLGPNPTNDEALSLLGELSAVLGIAVVIGLLAQVFLSGFLTVAVGKAVLGHPVDFASTWARVRPRMLALLGMTLIYPAVAIGAGVVAVLITLAVPPLGVLVIIAMVPISIWLLIMFSLSTPALMLESTRIGAAFGRSRRLVRGSWWRTFGILLLAWIIAGIVGQLILTPFSLIGGGTQLFSTEPVAPTLTSAILNTIGSIIGNTITTPFVAGVIVLLYTDKRMRKEGMDIELARAAGVAPPHPQ